MLTPMAAWFAALVACTTSPYRPASDRVCGLEDNALRPVCRFDVDEGVEVTLTYGVAGEPIRELRATGPDVRFGLWDLPPERDVAWTVAWQDRFGRFETQGTVRTGTVPPTAHASFADALPRTGPAAFERVLFTASCPVTSEEGELVRPRATLVVTDGEGVVRWYQEPPTEGNIRAYDVSPDGTMWMQLDRRTVHEVAFDGTLLRTLTQPVDFPHVTHHDLTARHGQTLLLHALSEEASDGETYIVDGLTEVGDEGADVVFSLSDAIEPRPTGPELRGYWGNGNSRQMPGFDFSHANAVDVDADGRWLITFKHLDAVMAFDGHPDAPDRGALLFSLVGGDRGYDDGDFTLLGPDRLPEGFEFPHHGRWLGPDRLSLVDNGRPSSADSTTTRVITVTLDGDVARIDQIYELGRFCPVHSSGYTIAGDRMLATCQIDSRLFVFDAEATLERDIQVGCANDSFIGRFPRAIPLDRDYRPLP